MTELEPKPQMVDKIVKELKINGIFDDLRKQCLADVDTKPAFQNLKHRVEAHVLGILQQERWRPMLNKNQLRNNIRNSVMQSGLLNTGIDRILHQVVDDKVLSVFLPKISEFIAENGTKFKEEFIVPPPQAIPPVSLPPPEARTMSPNGVTSNIPLENQITVPDEPHPDEVSVSMEIEKVDHSPEIDKHVIDVLKQEEPHEVTESSPATLQEQIISDLPNQIDSPSTPVIPDEAVNPLRNLIQSLLTNSKAIISKDADGNNDTNSSTEELNGGESPSIDRAHIEAFTDDEEEEDVEEYKPELNLTEEEDYYKYVAATEDTSQTNIEQTEVEDAPYSPTAAIEEMSSPINETGLQEEVMETTISYIEETSNNDETIEIQRVETAVKSKNIFLQHGDRERENKAKILESRKASKTFKKAKSRRKSDSSSSSYTSSSSIDSTSSSSDDDSSSSQSSMR